MRNLCPDSMGTEDVQSVLLAQTVSEVHPIQSNQYVRIAYFEATYSESLQSLLNLKIFNKNAFFCSFLYEEGLNIMTWSFN